MSRRNAGLRFVKAGRSDSLPADAFVDIERFSAEGRGIAHHAGQVWLVRGALPGERVWAQALRQRRQVVEACVREVVQSSPQRCAPVCPHVQVCGGCSLQHLTQADQLALKQADLAGQLQSLGVAEHAWLPPLQAESYGYRRRARLVLTGGRGQPWQIGFRQSGSHSVVGIDTCPVLRPALQILLQGIHGLLPALREAHKIESIELFEGDAVALLVHVRGALSVPEQARWRAFCQSAAVQLWWQVNAQGPMTDQEVFLSFSVDEPPLQLACTPGDFVQAHAALNQAMIGRALEWLEGAQAVLDLFCGLGNFTLPLARRHARVTGVEGSSAMVVRARTNAVHHGLHTVDFECVDLFAPESAAFWSRGDHDAVLLDPPREGALRVCSAMQKLGAQRVVYISCNPATLVRDMRVLLEQGYRVRRIGLVDMFPQTGHIETMVLLNGH